MVSDLGVRTIIFRVEEQCVEYFGFFITFVKRNANCVDADMTKQGQDIAYFLSFCIEQYMNDKGLNREQTMTLFSQYGVLDYLAAHFEILHTQSQQWIVEDIDDYIQNRKGATE